MTADRAGVARARARALAPGQAPVLAGALRRPPGWGLVSAATAPVAMIGGWTLAGALQPAAYDPARDTISALATSSATAGWVMTAGLAVTGVCHLVTAAGLRPASTPGRVLLAVGGAATAAVAALPVDVASRAHGVAAGVAFVALSVWPAAAAGPAVGAPVRRWSVPASVLLVALLVWFVLELQGTGPAGGALTGTSERVLAGAQSLWPLVVVLALRRRGLARRAGPRDPVTPWTP